MFIDRRRATRAPSAKPRPFYVPRETRQRRDDASSVFMAFNEALSAGRPMSLLPAPPAQDLDTRFGDLS